MRRPVIGPLGRQALRCREVAQLGRQDEVGLEDALFLGQRFAPAEQDVGGVVVLLLRSVWAFLPLQVLGIVAQIAAEAGNDQFAVRRRQQADRRHGDDDRLDDPALGQAGRFQGRQLVVPLDPGDR